MTRAAHLGRAAVLVTLAALVAVPGLLVLIPIARDLTADGALAGALLDPSERRALWTSAWVALVIALLASACGWMLAGVLARAGSFAGLMLLPTLVPVYLAYAGWGQLRAPGTWLGDWLLERASDGEHWWPILAGRAIAVLGLALWASPIAGLVLAGGIRRRGQGFEESLALDRAGPLARLTERLRFHLADALAAVAVVWVLMLGSAVPLHVAQVRTLSIELWLAMVATPPGEWGRLWAGTWPLVLVAGVAAWWLGGVAIRAAERDADDGERVRCGRSWHLSAWAVWSLAVLVPVVLAAINLSGWSAFERLWRLDGTSILRSLARASVVAGAIALLACAASVLLSSGSRADRSLLRWFLRLAILLGLLPGFAIGASLSRWGLATTEAGPILAQTARFAFIGLLAGVWACRSESFERRAARRLETRGVLRAWAATVLPEQWRTLAGAGLVGLALSVSEIEATVFVEPPGVTGGSLAQKTLAHLHFARMDELNATLLVVVALVAVPCVLAGLWIMRRRDPRDRN